ncbi:FmdE family protein [Megalodesulfovibrio paquesii]
MKIEQYTFQEFKEKAAAFHGYPAPGLLIGGYMVAWNKSLLPEGTIFDALVESPKCLPDAVQLLTLCSVGNGWMQVLNLGRYAVSLYDKYTGEGWRVYLDADKLAAWPNIHSWLFKTKPKREQDSDALFGEIEAAGHTICSAQRICIPERLRGHKHMGPVGVCPVCREPYPMHDGAVCRGCQGEALWEMASIIAPAPELKAVPVEEAVGKTALHDMTEVIPGSSKGPAVQAGQVIGLEDVCRLQRMGRRNIYLQEQIEQLEGFVHEDVAAMTFATALAGENVAPAAAPCEGKINLSATIPGLLTIDVAALERFNTIPNVACASRQQGTLVEAGKPFAACRAIPLYLTKENVARALATIDEGPVFAVHPLRAAKAGVLVTGSEVFQGLVQDKFAPLLTHKMEALGGSVVASRIVPDDRQAIADGVRELLDAGIDLLLTTAGLSVDPDDVTRHGLLDAGLTDALYGAPVVPGNMILIGRIGTVQVMGVPACALHAKTTAVDLLLPRLLAGLPPTRADLARMAEGGFCLQCRTCTFPKCPFGK